MRYKIIFSYLGKNYHGYQLQKNAPSVQVEIEQALKKITGEEIKIFASGRTDAGVSAIKQVAHFDLDKSIINLAKRLNAILPGDIRAINISRVNDDFHARFDCISKTYEYHFYHNECNIPYLDEFALYCKIPFDIEKMNEGAKFFLGRHDFTSFCAVGGSAIEKEREIYSAEFFSNRLGIYTFRVKGNGFLYNMIRIMLGTLFEVGYGKIPPSEIKRIIDAKNRQTAFKTISPQGLVLVDVEYKAVNEYN